MISLSNLVQIPFTRVIYLVTNYAYYVFVVLLNQTMFLEAKFMLLSCLFSLVKLYSFLYILFF
jgi:hypothetical protein